MTKTISFVWADFEKQAAIERLFGYAEHHLTAMRDETDEEKLRFCFDHFLLCVTAAVTNLQEALPVDENNDPVLCAPTETTVKAVSALAPVHWAWCARNKIAHDYLKLLDKVRGELTAGSFTLEIGDAPYMLEIDMLRAVKSEKGKPLSPPEMHPVNVADLTLRFWRSTYAYILENARSNKRYTFIELWNHHCKK